MKWLYKYSQRAYPYDDLVATNRRRSRLELEYELLDTGVFADNRYFDVSVEYAKASPEDILIRVTVENRGPEAATLHVLPTLWFRNVWTWSPQSPKPSLRQGGGRKGIRTIVASHPELGERWLCVEGDVPLLFTENETNNQRIFGKTNAGPFVKDGINDYIVHGRKEGVNPAGIGTKVATHHMLKVEAGRTAVIRLRLTDYAPGDSKDPFAEFDKTFEERRSEADEFYLTITPPSATEDEARVMRQALAGMLWSKQYYLFEAAEWIKDHGGGPFSISSGPTRNREWGHMVNDDIISMPDKWEYPWYAAWDLAFHTVAFSLVDIDFAKHQLDLMLGQMYLHPNGQIPAYEWNFSDVNPPVHAWATLALYRTEQAKRGEGDLAFLKRSFGKLLANFTWWVNRKDRFGKNVFEGDFLGLDNIGVFDRSAPLPTGGHIEQADGTAWMAFFSQNMLELAVEIAAHDASYDDLAEKFLDHVLWIAHAINSVGPDGMWDEEDSFFYDVLRLPDGSATRLKVRSVVGLLPLCATSVTEPWQRERVPGVMKLFEERSRRMPELLTNVYAGRGCADRGLMALVGHEYFHGDNGAGIGASHQTGWSGLVATLIELFRTLDAARLLEVGKEAAFTRDWAAPTLPEEKITV